MRTLLTVLVITLACALAGCADEKPQRQSQGGLVAPQTAPDDDGLLLVIAFDLSGSFRDLMTRDGRAFDFALATIDSYSRASLDAEGNEIVFAQLSATNKPLLWQGTPAQLRGDFDGGEAFRQMLLKKSDPHGSRIWDGLADVLEYVWIQPGVSTGKKKVVLIVLSDMEDTVQSTTAKPRLVKAIKSFARVNPAVGFYWVDQKFVFEWKKTLSDAGLKSFVVESEVRFNPTLPQFQ